MVVGGYVGLYGCAFCAMGLSVPLNVVCYEIQYSSTVTLILTEPETQTKRDTKKNYIAILQAQGPTQNQGQSTNVTFEWVYIPLYILVQEYTAMPLSVLCVLYRLLDY